MKTVNPYEQINNYAIEPKSLPAHLASTRPDDECKGLNVGLSVQEKF